MESEASGAGGELLLSPCAKHSEGQHFVVSDGGRLAYVSVPQEYAASSENEELCFTDHEPKDVTTDMCCPKESGHAHAHVHRGEIIEPILLEECIEGCGLPVLRELTGLCESVLQLGGEDHEHREGCGHAQISHGDHTDWLVPLKDGSFTLSHQRVQNGRPSFTEHGRLIKRGKTLAKINLGPALVEILSYESPKKKGYESLSQLDEDEDEDCGKRDSFQIGRGQVPDDNCTLLPRPSVGLNVVQGGMVKVDIPANYSAVLCKTRLDVMGICCPSEVPLIKKLLEPLPGVDDVSVNVTTRTVLVLHDQLLITDVQLVKVLNGAHLDASIHQRGELKGGRSWPSPWCLGSGVLVAISFFHYLYEPMEWVALGAVAVGVRPLILKAIAALRKFVLDINTLMLIAVGGAIALGDYLEAGTIVFLFALAEWLESRSTHKARSAIAAVVDRAPQSATLLDSGRRVRVEEVEVGTVLSVKAGDTIPIDGEVVSGRGVVDESSLTGESVPVEKEQGATLWAGTMNLAGYVTMKTTALSGDSAVARMVRLVEEAQSQRSPTEMLVERIAKYYTPAVVLAAVVIGLVPWASGVHNPSHWVYLALVLLVVACPCALVISTPVVVTCGIAQAARLGLLVKGGTYLEILGRLKVVALDKTGTLSEGLFCVSNMRSIDSISTLEQIMYWVTSVENKASHPLAAALVAYARLNGVEPSENVTDFEVIAGEGVTAVVDDHIVQIGNARMAARLGWDSAAAVETLANWSSSGATVGWIGVDGIALGIFSVGDQLRPEAAEAVRELKKLGIRVAMLTGDSSAAAAYVHNKIGEIDVYAELLPEDKVRIVQELKEHGVLAMVGDGINDAPALAAADVGIAMGVAGSAVAMDTADVALMTNDLRKLGAAVRLGLDCRWKIGQNITFSFVTKLLIIGLAAGGYASLWAAVVADVGTCLAVVFNSMRILKKGKHDGREGQCVATMLQKELKKNSNGSECDKDEVDSDCSETKPIAISDVQAPGISHKQRVRIPWLHKHHDDHHDKKEKCEDDLCCADKDEQPPCCSSARCEKKVLTSRGKGQRQGNNAGGFDKMKGVRTGSQVCESDCCSDIRSPAADVSKDLALNASDGPGVLKAVSGCCSKGSCKSSNKKTSPETEVSKDSELNVSDGPGVVKAVGGCCSKGSCKSSNKKTFSPETELSKDSELNVSDGPEVVKAVGGCCSKGSCKSLNKKIPSTATEVSKDSELNVSDGPRVVKAAGGCCSKGSCKSSNKTSPSPAADVSKDSELNVSDGPGVVKAASGCCSNGSCKSSNKKTPSPSADVSKDSELNVSDGVGVVKAVGGCCSNGSCKSSNKKSLSPAAEVSKNSELNVSDGVGVVKELGGCCSNGSCKSSNKKTTSPSADVSKDSELNVSDGVGVVKAVGGCCSNGSCKSSNKKSLSPAAEVNKDSELNVSDSPGVVKAAAGGCCSNGSCKSSNKTTPTPAADVSKDSELNVSDGVGVVKAVGGCCSNGSCKSSNKKSLSPAAEVNKDSELNVSDSPGVVKAAAGGCCSNGSCKSSNKTTPTPAADVSKDSELKVSDGPGVVKAAGGCCSKGSCKSSNKKTPSPQTGVSKDLESNVSDGPGVVKAVGGCCSKGSCKSSNKTTPTPAAEVNKDSELKVSDGPGVVKAAGGCCSKGSCKSSNKKTPSPQTGVSKDLESNVSDGPGVVKAVGGCCSKGSCKSSNKTTPSPAAEMSKDLESNVSDGPGVVKAGGGCCSKGSCKSSNKTTPSPAADVSNDSELNVSDGALVVKAVGGCCSTGSCKSSNKKTPSPAFDVSTYSNRSASNRENLKEAVGYYTSDGCKPAEGGSEHVPANLASIDISGATDHLSQAAASLSDSCCADPSSCRSCITSVTSEAQDNAHT